MDEIITLLIPAFLAIVLVRAMLLPIRLAVKLTVYSGCGFACLWLLNLASPVTGIAFPINAVTILIAGILGLPGIGVLAILAVI